VSEPPLPATPKRGTPWQLTGATLAGLVLLGAVAWGISRAADEPEPPQPSTLPRGATEAAPSPRLNPASPERKPAQGHTEGPTVGNEGVMGIGQPNPDPTSEKKAQRRPKSHRRPLDADPKQGTQSVRAFPDLPAEPGTDARPPLVRPTPTFQGTQPSVRGP
jgi:hypothetical protein